MPRPSIIPSLLVTALLTFGAQAASSAPAPLAAAIAIASLTLSVLVLALELCGPRILRRVGLGPSPRDTPGELGESAAPPVATPVAPDVSFERWIQSRSNLTYQEWVLARSTAHVSPVSAHPRRPWLLASIAHGRCSVGPA